MSNFCVKYSKIDITSKNQNILTIAIFKDEVRNDVIFNYLMKEFLTGCQLEVIISFDLS